MRNVTKTIALLFLGGMALTSCKKDVTASEEIPQAVKDQIFAVGFGTSNIQKVEEGYLVEGDIILTEEFLNSSPQHLVLRAGTEEQYHTTNLVTGLPREITVSMSSDLTAKAGYLAALDEMVVRYNAQNLLIHFTRIASGGDITFVNANGPYLASAGFPTNSGNPYGRVKVYSRNIGTGNTSTFINYLATILAHETGHCVGFRHTDYMDRSYSCGGAYSNEGASTVGAIHIPSTPEGPDPNSFMLACISRNENRPFNANDRSALNYLY